VVIKCKQQLLFGQWRRQDGLTIPTWQFDVDFQMLDANMVLRQVADAWTKLNLVILDAAATIPLTGGVACR